ncbi:MAG: hypothetical protein KUG81_06530 [Gammaproteobacteria bacterium]|nr:hypothetical protein [Gammaproteobacteria bacterium]
MRIALDIDDVLAGFYSGICKREGVPEEFTNFWDGEGSHKWLRDLMMSGDMDHDVIFWSNLGVLSNPNSINFEVAAYITSSPDSMLWVRKLWLTDNRFPEAPVLHCKNKAETMKRLKIDLLVDDSPKTVHEVNSVDGLHAIQFIPPYMSNVGPYETIRHLSQVPALVELLKYNNGKPK